MNKSQIRKKILNSRKKIVLKNSKINFQFILDILKREKINGKVVGGYYSFNYEIDVLNILEKFEKKKYQISLPKMGKN